MTKYYCANVTEILDKTDPRVAQADFAFAVNPGGSVKVFKSNLSKNNLDDQEYQSLLERFLNQADTIESQATTIRALTEYAQHLELELRRKEEI